ncbi:MAG TPA: XdhC/CoxI family protein [Candidatus Cloacimonadota bacterium]|nr:XdhC/CoxI family protein [Candidatus Cloacimonadota bacterium]
MMEHLDFYRKICDCLAENCRLWQLSVVSCEGSSPAKPGMKLCVPLQGREFGNLGGGEVEHSAIAWVRENRPSEPVLRTYMLSEQGDQALADEEIPTRMICGGKVSILIEPLAKSRTLYIVGAGHCGRALGQLAKLAGWWVHLIDNRNELLESDLSLYGDVASHSDYSDVSTAISFDREAHIVIMTHGHAHDKQVLEQCLRREFAYLGMIGSASKVAQTFSRLKEQGFSDAELARVHAPIGLPIGSHTPFEIAVSIMAELISIHKRK